MTQEKMEWIDGVSLEPRPKQCGVRQEAAVRCQTGSVLCDGGCRTRETS